MTRSTTHSSETPSPVILVAAGFGPGDLDGPVRELESLLVGLGHEVPFIVTQRHAPRGASHVVGPGKLEELRSRIAQVRDDQGVIPLLAFACEVSPSQQRTIEREFETEALDRADVILRVFEQRARSKLSRLELEHARLARAMPRVRDDDAHDDREGGGGRGGRGDSNVELTKQQYRSRMAELRRQIEVEHEQRRRREERRADAPTVALVGYTNSGKSSLMRALTGSDVYVENKLFATLETTVRLLSPRTSPPILVSDTVGFIQDLPHDLVGSFRSTLDEALGADLLLQIVDAADPRQDIERRVTDEVLRELGAHEVPRWVLFNKRDLIDQERMDQLRSELPDAHFISAHDAADVAELRSLLVTHFQNAGIQLELSLPFAELSRLAELREQVHVEDERYDENGVTFSARGARDVFERLGFIEPPPRVKEDWE